MAKFFGTNGIRGVFPDDFNFKGSKESVRKQIGMAVPSEGATIIFEALLKSFLNINYEYIEPRFGLK